MPTNILMPALSPTMTEGTLAKWLKKEGDMVKSGDVIAEIETDKATMEVEAADEGKLGKIIVPAGTAGVAVNAVIAVLVNDNEKVDLSALQSSAQNTPSPSQGEGRVGDKVQTSVSQSPTPTLPLKGGGGSAALSSTARIIASPLAKRIANERGVDLRGVVGTGPRGRIVKDDVLNANTGPRTWSGGPVPQGAFGSSPKATGGLNARALADAYGMTYTAQPNSSVRKVIAARLSESKQTIPHFYLTTDCVLDTLLAARADINDAAKGAYKLSVNDFVIKAVAMSLRAYPAANVAWTDDAILQFDHADISVAVATPNGLITPIIKAAETKSLPQISAEMKDLAARARDGKLKPVEFQGGTFSISNLGMYGITEFAAIINPPQACILAVGAGVEQPVVVGGKIEVRTVMKVTLSVDHRAVDGAAGAEFLQVFKRMIENPTAMFV
jgi:pyruvate dehydrogenase E2 component (dihydrolipoamide acetyltransferase)